MTALHAMMEEIELITAIFQQQQWLETWRLELRYVFSFLFLPFYTTNILPFYTTNIYSFYRTNYMYDHGPPHSTRRCHNDTTRRQHDGKTTLRQHDGTTTGCRDSGSSSSSSSSGTSRCLVRQLGPNDAHVF
jgi:hypothetical protein